MITLLVMIHIITSCQGHLQNKNLLGKQIHLQKIWGLMILFTGQKHSHSNKTILMVKQKGEDLMHQRSMGVFVHVVTEKT